MRVMGSRNAGLLSATAIGLTMVAAPVSADDGAGVTSLDAVTVSATRTEKKAIEAPAAITVIGQEEIERSQPQSLGDVLKSVPGVIMDGGPRNTAEQPNIRGFSGEQVVIRVDGARKNFNSGHRGRVFLDPELLKQVDVLRGPNSLLYGSGAIGGVVNLETKSAFDLLEPGQSVGARVKSGYQSNNSEISASASIFGAPSEDLGLLFNATHRNSGNIETGAGDEIPASGDDLISGLLKADLERGGHTASLSLQRYENDDILPTAANTDSDLFAERVTKDDTYSLSYGYDGFDGLANFDATVYYSDVFIREILLSNGRHDVTESDTLGLDVANTSRFMLSDWATADVTYGLEIFRDQQSGHRNGGPRPQFPDAEKLSEGYFVQSEFTLWDRLTVTPGLRFDRFDLEADGEDDRSDEEVSKKLAVAYEFTPWLTGFGSYSEAFRAPSLTELYATGTHFVFNTFVPNPDLKPEFARNKEIGVAMSFDDVVMERDALRIKASAYRNNVDDLIELEVEGGIFGTTTARNVTEAEIEGVELEVGYDAPEYFMNLAASRIRGDDLTENEPLTDTPEDKVSVSAGYRWLTHGLTAGWRSTLYAGQDRLPAGTEAVPGTKVIHDLFVSWVPNDDDLDGLRVDFGIDNIFDKDHQKFLSAIREAGRNVKISASYKF